MNEHMYCDKCKVCLVLKKVRCVPGANSPEGFVYVPFVFGTDICHDDVDCLSRRLEWESDQSEKAIARLNEQDKLLGNCKYLPKTADGKYVHFWMPIPPPIVWCLNKTKEACKCMVVGWVQGAWECPDMFIVHFPSDEPDWIWREDTEEVFTTECWSTKEALEADKT